MKRKLFCELSPTAYRISRRKGIILRGIADAVRRTEFADAVSDVLLPSVVYRHSSLIRRVLGNTDMTLQENKAHNLALAAPHINGLVIRPGEVFSFWKRVGEPSQRRGYREGLAIVHGVPSSGIGGGLCQFTNLIHWMVLHSPLEIVEHHHHDGIDLFPDYGRTIPFGTGTSVGYSYIDYRFINTTEQAFQLVVYVTDTHLCGELRSEIPLGVSYHVYSEGERFVHRDGAVWREGRVWRRVVDKRTGNTIGNTLIRENNARVMYDTSGLCVDETQTSVTTVSIGSHPSGSTMR